MFWIVLYIIVVEATEVQTARNLFGEKVKELSLAIAKVDSLTRQLEELKKKIQPMNMFPNPRLMGNSMDLGLHSRKEWMFLRDQNNW